MAFLAVVVVLGLGALVAVPTERVAGLVADRLSAATGRTVTMEGELRPTLFPSLGVRVGDVTVGNPDWVDAGPMIAAERLDVSVEWAPLLRGEIRLDRAEFVAPRITLVRAADGRTSWDVADEAQEAGTGPATAADDTDDTARRPMSVGFDRAAITRGEVLWIDEAASRTVAVGDLDAVLTLAAGASRATLQASADVEGHRMEADLAIDGLEALLAGQVRPASARVSWSGGEASFDGRMSLAPALEGAVVLEATDPGPLLSVAGMAMPELPEGAGRERIGTAGQVTLTDAGSFHLRDGTLTLDDNAFSVALDMLPAEARPAIRGVISGGTITLGSAGASGGGSDGPAEAAAGSAGWSSEPIDFSPLFAVDADLSLRLDGVALEGAELGAVEIAAMLDAGRAVLDIGRVDAYGGRLGGEVVVNGRDGGSVGGDLILTGVQLSPLLEEFAGYDRLEGTGSASLEFRGAGADMASIMSGLEGRGDFAFGAGAIIGLDLVGMIRNLDASYRGEGARTVYDSISANFTISQGVLRNDDLALDAPWGGVEGAGSVDLGARTIDYRVIPGVLRQETGEAGIAVPILVSGPWSGPTIRPDLEYLAEQELGEQRDRLINEAEARLAEEREQLEDNLRERANEVLGTEIGAGDGRAEIEDAVENRLSEETQNVLSRLLGGGDGGAEDAGTDVSE